MADSKTFVLIGEFKDGISPQLEKINNSVNSLKRNLGSFSAKKGGFDDLTKSMGKVIAAHKQLNAEVTSLRENLSKSISVLKQYRTEVGKTVAASRHIARTGSSTAAKAEARFWDQASSSARRYQRQVSAMRSTRIPTLKQPSAPAPLARLGRYSEGPAGSSGALTGAVAGGIVGTQISGVMTDAIVQGFRIGVSLMEAPFRYFSSALQERIRDELDDLRAAGGFYSISKRQKDPFVRTMDEAIDFQQETNSTMAKLAGALPGVTNDYVQVSKRLSDTIARVVSKDITGAIAEANKIRATAEGAQFYGKQITDTGRVGQQEAIKTLLGEMTKKTVLAGMGGRAGAGGMMGPYGLPGLAERMLSQEQVSMSQFQRYAAIFSDPMIADALGRHVDDINKTQAGTLARVEAFNAMMNEIVTPELVEKLRTSFDGVYQSMRSAIVDPDTGIFGLGRQFKNLGKRINSVGEYLNEAGEVVASAQQAADANLSLFELVRDIFTQVGQVLTPFLTYLPEVWDPLKNIANILKDARHYTTEFVRSFNMYRNGLKEYAQSLPKASQLKIMESLDIRAALAAVNNLFAEFKVIDEKKFKSIASQIESPDANIAKLMSEMLDTFFKSEVATKIGEFLGELIGTVLKQVADATKFVSGVVQGGGFAGGFSSAFQKAGGFQAIQDIFTSIVQLFVKALLAAVTKMPLLSLTVAGLALLPVIIGAAVQNMVERMMDKCTGLVSRGACPMPDGGGAGGRGRRQRRGGFMGAFESPSNERRRRRIGSGIRERVRPYTRAASTVGAFGQDALYSAMGSRSLIRQRNVFGNLARTGAKLGRAVPGGALAGGAIDMGLAMASGENFGKAAAGAIGTVLGGVVGSAFGPVGTMIGMTAGGMIGDATADLISSTSKGPNLAQKQAADLQLQAARLQDQAAKLQAGGLESDAVAYTFGTAQQFSNRLQALGLGADQAAISLNALYSDRERSSQAAKAAADALNKKITELSNQKVPPDLIAQQVRPLQEQFNKAKRQLERSQAAFDAQFRKTPSIIQKSITDSFSALSFKNVEAIIAGKFNQIQIPQFPTSAAGLTLMPPQPANQGFKPPNFLNWDYTPKAAQTNVHPIFTSPGKQSTWPWAKGGLGDAVAKEIKMKPPGSDLVVANTSETIIPAADGNKGTGMLAFVDTLRTGFASVVNTLRQTENQTRTSLYQSFVTLKAAYERAQQAQQIHLSKINQTLVTNQQQTNARLAKLETKFTTPGIGGLGGASAGGGVDAFTPIAQRYGLQMTSGYRPGDPGWHGANRARDYSNSTGPTPQMMQFAQYLASTYGSNLKELIYTPLGFSIKNGQRVAPYAQGSHYNHVHVAYGLGAGNPAFFSSAGAADRWESAMARREPIISSVRATASEVGGGNYTINAPITINQQPGQDPDTLASLVVMKLSMEIDRIRSSTA